MRKNIDLFLYRKMYLIRKSEEVIVENYGSDEMKTPMHMSMGSEAIAVGVCAALKPTDQVFGTYRSHALYLAKGGDPNKFFAEMYGKLSGVAKGKGGSMHLSAPEKGFLATSAVVASTIPLAVGTAYANKYQKNNKIVAVFFGDGAIDEGAFWESLNMASLLKLQIMFVLEDNGLAVHTSGQERHGYSDILSIVSNLRCSVFASRTTDASVICSLTKKAINSLKRSSRPVFMHLKYYRYLEHVGIFQDFDKGYRNKSEFEKWFRLDPLKIMREKLLKSGLEEQELASYEKQINKKIQKSLKDAMLASYPDSSELYSDLFYEKAKN